MPPLILSVGTRCVISLTPRPFCPPPPPIIPQYALSRKLWGPHSKSGHFGWQNNILSLAAWNNVNDNGCANRDSGRTAQWTLSRHYKEFRERLLSVLRTHTHTCECAVETDWQFSGFHRPIHDIFTLLGCYTELICRYGISCTAWPLTMRPKRLSLPIDAV